MVLTMDQLAGVLACPRVGLGNLTYVDIANSVQSVYLGPLRSCTKEKTSKSRKRDGLFLALATCSIIGLVVQ